ncbi:MAG: hypothetical protein H6838_20360 [Planctomycetes bacterium]|nr:hypothetical protein [Planctomycetota bacterium]MCB9887849.1 hypothetical protein [Planctomycetota bacterium]
MLVCLLAANCASCSLMPRELNLAPLWFHRLDENGEVLEYDFLWPIVHYERTAEGGDDFRIRPLWRRVTEPTSEAEPAFAGAPDEGAVEHQFLWPLGQVRSDRQESKSRLFPLWSWRSRLNEEGLRDVDWYALFPFVWGGASADGRENYLAVLPFYADIPQFLSYDRFRTVLFPLFVQVDKEGHRHRLLLWPLIGWSSCAENGHQWFRILPFYGHDIEPGQHDRRFALWPFFAWSDENLDFEDPVHSVWIWPLVGWRTGRSAGGWMALWPLFQYAWKTDHFTRLTILWPFFHYYWNRAQDHMTQYWFWPFAGRVQSDDQRAWSFLWPLIWWREYDDPDGTSKQQWVLPFFWHIGNEGKDGSTEDFLKIWPLFHRTVQRDADGNRVGGDFSLLSPLPWRNGNADGMAEMYGFLWEVFTTRQRAADDRAVDVAGRLFTSRERHGETTASVPFLGSYERDRTGQRTLRLFGLLPISLGGGDAPATPTPTTEEAPR